jgi:hypothetical protein
LGNYTTVRLHYDLQGVPREGTWDRSGHNEKQQLESKAKNSVEETIMAIIQKAAEEIQAEVCSEEGTIGMEFLGARFRGWDRAGRRGENRGSEPFPCGEH